jgi:ABC-type Na+ efflux pump permease subunit
MCIFVFFNFFVWIVFVATYSRLLSDLILLILIFQLLVVLVSILVTGFEFFLYISYKYKKYKFEYDKNRMEDIKRLVIEFKLFEQNNIIY